MIGNRGNTLYRNTIAASIYWIILGIFLYSYLHTGNPISLSVATDRVVDALSISFIFLVNRIAGKPDDAHHSYGFHRVETLLNTSVILLFTAMAVYSALETTHLLLTNAVRSPGSAVIPSIMALVLLLISAFFLDKDEKSNFSVLFNHTFQDLGAIIVTLAFSLASEYFTGLPLDYIGSYAVLVIIIYGNRKMFGRNINILLEGSPVSIKEVEDRIREEFPNAHHLHIWDICQHERVATLHLSVPFFMKIGDLYSTKARIEDRLSAYGVNHVTIQFESEESAKPRSDTM